MHSQASLLDVLRGCFNSNTIHACEQQLKKRSYNASFLQDLLRLMPNQQKDILMMIMTTLKSHIMQRYNSQNDPMPLNQKQTLKEQLFQIFYVISHNTNAVQVLKNIMYSMILVQFPWQGIQQILEQDLNGQIMASVYFIRQVAKVNQYLQGEPRQKFQMFIDYYFPKLEVIVQQILSNFNPETAKLLFEITKTLFSTFHVAIPNYFRNIKNLQTWILYLKTILDAPNDPSILPSQEMASRAYIKFFSLYTSDTQDGKNFKGWARNFTQNYIEPMFKHVVMLIGQKKGNQIVMSNLVSCLQQVVRSKQLIALFTDQHCRVLFYGGCLLPFCQSSPEELSMFKSDPIEYVRRQEDLNCFTLRNAVLGLIQVSASALSFGDKSQMMRLVEYSASVLDNQSSSDPEKEVVIRILIKVGRILLQNRYLKGQFQNLTNNYFIPLLRNPNSLLNALICQLLSCYLPFGDLDSQTVGVLMELIYDKIVNFQSLVIKYNAILAFTALLNHRAALEAAQPHFQNILQIYVGILNSFDHQKLLSCLESMVRNFSKQIVSYAPDLISHLLGMFKSFASKDEGDEELDDQPDKNSPATAALSTLRQILTCQLGQNTFYNISGDFIDLLRGSLSQYDKFSEQILSIFNVLIHRAKKISDFEYPYALCRILLEGNSNNNILNRSQCFQQLLVELRQVQQADAQCEESLISILKNLIQKMPQDILLRYPYPNNAQLLLCLIQNQKIPIGDFNMLNTSQVDKIWTPYLTSYSSLIYNLVQLSQTDSVRLIIGVSMFPWLKKGINSEIVRLVLGGIEQQQEDDADDLLEENTAQMLQKYANEDDDQQSYYEGQGINYGYLYDSPFDVSRDKELMIQALRGLPQNQAVNIVNALSPRHRKKLQILMSTN